MCKVLFMQNWFLEYPGTMSLSAFLKQKGFKVEMLITSDKETIIKQIRKKNPTLIAFNCSTTELNWILDTAKKIKAVFNIPILLGGIHPTIFPEVILNSPIDFICRGEGEQATYELLKRIKGKNSTTNIKNIWAKKNGRIYRNPIREPIKNLDALPFPDRSIYNKYPQIRNSSFAGFTVGRGCPFHCSFCYANYLKNIYKPYPNFVRLKSPEYLIKEIKQVLQNYNIKTMHFYDSIFPANKRWLDEFLDLYKRVIKLPFTINLRADTMDKGYILKLKNAGCIGVAIGLESGNEKIRNKILKKKILNKTYLNSANIIKKLRMKLLTFNMLAIPTENMDKAIETVIFNQRLKTDYALCTFLHPFPNLDITNFALSKDLIDTSVKLKGYSKPSPLIKVKNKNEFIKLNSLFFLFIKLKLPRTLIKVILKILPMRFCNIFGKYNQFCHWRFHKLKLTEVKLHFNSICKLKGV